MSYKVKTVPVFDKEVKRIFKKHRGIKSDLSKLIEDLETNPNSGTHLGNNIYKIRLAISGTNKGKSGGARIITYVYVVNEVVYLTNIYLKSEYESINVDDILAHLKNEGIIQDQ